MDFCDKVKDIRKQLNMTQTDFSKELGVDYTTLSRIERGIFKPSFRFMEKLKIVCGKYGIEMEEATNLLNIKSVKTTDLFEDIVNVIDSSYSLANKTVNYILIQRNWLIGKRIVENELSTRKDDYGKSVIKELSQKLTQKYGTGFETRNIYYFIDFYNSFPNILQSVNANSLLSWTHYVKLLQVSDVEARNWYASEAVREAWSVRTLQRNISSQYYNRMVSSLVK